VPGVDFGRVRTRLTMEQVLCLLGFSPRLHESTSGRRRSLSVNLAISQYFCHGWHSHGNQLEL
jgi:hypothetical protein